MRFYLLVLFIFLMVLCSADDAKIKFEKVINGGLQPKVIQEENGRAHLIYYAGADNGGDLFYTQRDLDGVYSSPVKINKIDGSAIAIGTIRGAQFCLGADGVIHVIWNGSAKAKINNKPPLYYARFDPDKK